MVLQRDTKINVWGWASTGEKVTIQFNHKTYKTTTNNKGKWTAQLAPVKAGGPYTMEISGKNKIILTFANTGSGLITNDGEPLSEFAIAGADKKFVWANAVIEGNRIIVSSEEITAPKYVRYAWADNPVNPNLFNKEGLPASPFRTDN